jgi:hypothetical protein
MVCNVIGAARVVRSGITDAGKHMKTLATEVKYPVRENDALFAQSLLTIEL